jgi:RNA polymerase sigma-70 factor (ECF subfamily)
VPEQWLGKTMKPVSLPPGAEPCHRVGGVPLADLVRDFHQQMVNFARSMIGSPAAAEEAVQEAWVQVMQSSCSFEGRSSVATWLFAIVKNTASRHRQRESRIRAHEVLPRAEADPLTGRMHPPGHPEAGHWSDLPSKRFLPEDRTVARELFDHVRSALEALPPRQRQLVLLRDLIGMSAEEAAEILEVSGQAQRALLYRARGNLRAELERRYAE